MKTNPDNAAIRDLLERYASLNNANDATGIAAEIYGAPALYVAADGSHTSVPDQPSIAAAFKAFIAARASSGRTGIEVAKTEVSLLSDQLAIAFVDYIQKQTTGDVKDGWFYVLKKQDGKWQVILLAPRDLDQ